MAEVSLPALVRGGICGGQNGNGTGFSLSILLFYGPGSVDGIATSYGLDGPGIEFRCGRGFPHLSRPAMRPTQPPVQWVPALSWGVK